MIRGLLGAKITEATTEKKANLFDRYENAEGSYIYVQANGAITAGSLVQIDDEGQAVSATTTNVAAKPAKGGIAVFAFADDQYGFVFVRGGGAGKGITVNAAASCVHDAKLYTTSTAGVVDDNASSTIFVQGLSLVTTVGGAQAATEVYAPVDIRFNC